jgi:dihydrolipoamide dehydrogenase
VDYDLCIIGAGWAGFNAGLGAAKLGKKVCIVEEKEIGGTCLNRGCIPTKIFVHHSKSGSTLEEIQKKKDDVVARLKDGMSFLVKTQKIDFLQGRALIKKDGSVAVGPDKVLRPKFILIATGSAPKELPQVKIDHDKFLSSDDALLLSQVPKKLLVVGAGAIGCEFACIFQRLGSDVTIMEIEQQLLPGTDSEVSRKLQMAFQKKGMTIFLGRGIDGFDLKPYDKILISTGRRAVMEGLWEDGAGVKTEKGLISVDRELMTNKRAIFAAGDCIGGYMLAHVASYEGELAVNNMFSTPAKRDYAAIPSSVFTMPEVSSVGLTEEDARGLQINYKISKVHFLSVGMAHVFEDTQGFAKVLVDAETGKILGAAIIGLQASELINIFSLVMKNNITIKALRNTIFAHPSISEIVAEVAKNMD